MSLPNDLQPFDRITATFTPRRTDDLKPGAHAFIGTTIEWEVAWIIEEGPYEGEWAMVPAHYATRPPFAWAPSGDLTPVEAP